MTITQTGRRAALVGLLALVAALLPFTGASAISGDEAVQLTATDNVSTSIANSQVTYTPLTGTPDNAPTEALIGRSDLFADNLASGALQGQALANGRPLFLNDSTDGVNADVLAEMDRILADGATVHILGGTAAQGEGVETALTDAGYTVNRFSGTTRTETAIDIADEVGADTALLVRSEASADASDETQAFADALGAGALAATEGYSILFTQTNDLTDTTAEFLAGDNAPTNVIVVGGTLAVSEEVMTEVAGIVSGDVTRVSGPTRFDTAVELNGLRGTDDAGDFAIAVDGQDADSWADGFTMANLSGLGNYPLVLTNDGAVPQATQDYLDSINENAFAAHFTDAFVLCGASTGDACQALADLYNLTVVPFPAPVVDPGDAAGVIIAEDEAGDSYTYQPADGSDAVEVDFDVDEDTFTVDGRPATGEFFDDSIDLGDGITVTENADGTFTHDLVNVDAADTGVIGNVNTAAGTFHIIEPVSGVTISDGPIDYLGDCDLYDLNGLRVTLDQFEDALNEGDSFDTSEDAAENAICDLTDGTVSGMVTIGDTVVADTDFFQIGNLGDDFASTNNDTFVASAAKFDAETLLITIDGEAITDYAEFPASLTDGDNADYSRTGGIEMISLLNAEPTTLSGQAVGDETPTDGLDLINDSFFLATADGKVSIEYGPDANFVVNGFDAVEANFITQYSAGDAVTYTPADGALGIEETVTLTDQNLAGAVGDVSSAANTYEVLAADGETVLDTVTYTDVDEDLFVNGVEVDEADFDEAIDAIADGDSTGTITYDTSGVEPAHRLVLTDA